MRSCSLRVPQTDVSAHTGHYCWCTGTTVSFVPHELVHIRRQHVIMNSLHSLELRLDSVPVGLDILCVNEVQRMVDHLVLYHRTQLLHICPRVTMYFGPTPQMALHNGQQTYLAPSPSLQVLVTGWCPPSQTAKLPVL